MFDFISILFLVLALCADAFTASFVYGADRVKIPFASAAIITLLSTGILAVFLFAGKLLSPFLSGNLSALIGTALLLILGLSKLTARPTGEVARHANAFEPEILSPSEAFPLGIALSLDSAAAGAGAGLSGNSIPLLLLLSLAFGFLSIVLGSVLGRRASAFIRLDFSRLSGLVLIVLAIGKLI